MRGLDKFCTGICLFTCGQGLGSKSQGPELSCKSKVLLAGDQGGAAGVPVIVKPVGVVPAPPAAAPVQVPNAEVAVGVAVNSTPEEDRFSFPTFRNQFRMLEIELKHVGVHRILGFKQLTKLMALNRAGLLLVRQIQLHLRGIVDELTTPAVFLHLPSFGDERVSVEVNRVVADDDLQVPTIRQPFRGLLAGTSRIKNQSLDGIPIQLVPARVFHECKC